MRFATDAVVIRRGPFSETSQIVDLLTASEGRITALARGAHRTKSPFGGPIDLATRGVAHVQRRPSTELDLLLAFPLTHPYRGLRATPLRYVAACHGLELIKAFAWPRDLERGLFPLLTGYFGALDADHGAGDGDAFRAALEAWLLWLPGALLATAGVAPRLAACAACGMPADPAAPAPVSFWHGGLLCRNCAVRARDRGLAAIPCSPGVLALLRRATAEGPDAAAPPGPSPSNADVEQARRLLDLYLEYRIERPLRSRRLLELRLSRMSPRA